MATSRTDVISPTSWYSSNTNIGSGLTAYGSGRGTAITETRVKEATLVKMSKWQKMPVKPIQPYLTQIWHTVNPVVSWTNTDVYSDHIGRHDALCDVRAYGANLDPVGSIDMSHVQRIATNKLLQKLNTAKSSAMVSLAEAGKTATLIAGTATRIVSALRALRRFDAAGVSKALGITTSRRHLKKMSVYRRHWELDGRNTDLISRSRQITTREYVERYQKVDHASAKDFFGSAWLEYSYGWKPLLNDIYDNAEALAHVMTEHQNLLFFESATAEESKTFKKDAIINESREYSAQTNHSVRVKIQARYTTENVGVAETFGLQNPLLVAWELVPFSFVADWFLPIGNALENFTATNGLTFHGGFVSSKTIIKTTCRVQSRAPSSFYGGTRYPGGGGTASTEHVLFNRSLLHSFPSPSFPAFKDPRSFSHAASAISLLNSLFLTRRVV